VLFPPRPRPEETRRPTQAQVDAYCREILNIAVEEGRIEVYCPPEPMTEAGCSVCSLKDRCQFSGTYQDKTKE